MEQAVVIVELTEEERQLCLSALAKLSVDRPGWDDALHRIALKIDTNVGGRASLFDQLRELHSRQTGWSR
jgi:hypothetical protein